MSRSCFGYWKIWFSFARRFEQWAMMRLDCVAVTPWFRILFGFTAPQPSKDKVPIEGLNKSRVLNVPRMHLCDTTGSLQTFQLKDGSQLLFSRAEELRSHPRLWSVPTWLYCWMLYRNMTEICFSDVIWLYMICQEWSFCYRNWRWPGQHPMWPVFRNHWRMTGLDWPLVSMKNPHGMNCKWQMTALT